MAMFNPRPGDTKEGEVKKDVGGPETLEFKDALLFDFDIDSDIPKQKHFEYLREVVRYMRRVLNLGSGRAFVVWIDGFASRTGTAQHNEYLSAMREQAVESQLRTALDIDQDLKPLVDFNRRFHGFHDSPLGESALYRAVRIVVTRPGPPPPPIKFPPTGSTLWKIRLTVLLSVGVPVPFVPGANLEGDGALFEIVDKSPGGKIGLFRFLTKFPGISISVPKLGPISGGGLGDFRDFTTDDRVDLRDFEGDASLIQPPAILNLSLDDTQLAIQSHTFMMKEVHTRPDPLPIDGVSVIATLFAASMGTLKLLQIDGRSV